MMALCLQVAELSATFSAARELSLVLHIRMKNHVHFSTVPDSPLSVKEQLTFPLWKHFPYFHLITAMWEQGRESAALKEDKLIS